MEMGCEVEIRRPIDRAWTGRLVEPVSLIFPRRRIRMQADTQSRLA
jgi:hypothetical protein